MDLYGSPNSVRSVLSPSYVGEDVEAAFRIDPQGAV